MRKAHLIVSSLSSSFSPKHCSATQNYGGCVCPLICTSWLATKQPLTVATIVCISGMLSPAKHLQKQYQNSCLREMGGETKNPYPIKNLLCQGSSILEECHNRSTIRELSPTWPCGQLLQCVAMERERERELKIRHVPPILGHPLPQFIHPSSSYFGGFSFPKWLRLDINNSAGLKSIHWIQ